MENIVLIGFMGTGKSTVAKTLGKMFQMKIVEMDQEIVSQEDMTIPEIFSKHGEEYFRNCETRLLMDLQKKENVIISCGGGTPLRECNVIEMKKNGKVILLTAKPETIWARIKDNTDRPLLKGNMNVEYIKAMMEQRREKYFAAADVIVETDGKKIKEICQEIIEKTGKGELYV